MIGSEEPARLPDLASGGGLRRASPVGWVQDVGQVEDVGRAQPAPVSTASPVFTASVGGPVGDPGSDRGGAPVGGQRGQAPSGAMPRTGTPRRANAPGRWPPLWIRDYPDLLLVPALLVLVALSRLVSYASAYDVYVDEYFYQQMGASVAAGHLPPGDGREMFVLHPPGFFVLEALWRELTSPLSAQFDQVMAMRQLQIVLAVGTALGIYLLLRRIAGRRTAVIAALVFAVDPFVLRQNGRVLLETATMAFVVLGWVPILGVVRGRARHPALASLGGGLVLGCATVTKDLGLFVTTIPLLAVLVFRWGLTRRQAAVAALASLVPYGLFVAGVVGQGGAAQLWQAKAGALSRLFGVTVVTGYNMPGAPSLIDVALAQLDGFVASYLIMGLGTIAAVWLVLKGPGPEHRIIGAIELCAAVPIGYGAAFATSEEHLFYLVLVPALLSLAVAVVPVLEVISARRGSRGRAWGSRWAAVVVAVALVVVAVADLGAWVRTRTTPDDGQRRVVAWIRQNVPENTAIAYVAGQTEFQLAGTPWRALPLDSPATMAAAQVRYLVVLQKEVQQGYSSVSPQEVAWFTARGREVFAFVGPSYGRVSIYQTVDAQAW
ncbi:MAG TPA: phospholipid carrier-dependent glycosyltransferase [Kineosporiaceae bacterium]|nr:phospholipid carrier-dependent glycosyltransferase [Kineosporiaceae bacterium]